MNLHYLVQSLCDSAVTLDELAQYGRFDGRKRREIAGVLRGSRLVLEEIAARALPVGEADATPGWMSYIEELDLSRGRLDSNLAALEQQVVGSLDDLELELALERMAERMREHAEAELSILSLPPERTFPAMRRAR